MRQYLSDVNNEIFRNPRFEIILALCIVVILSRLTDSSESALIAFHAGIVDLSTLGILKSLQGTFSTWSTNICILGAAYYLLRWILSSTLLVFKRNRNTANMAQLTFQIFAASTVVFIGALPWSIFGTLACQISHLYPQFDGHTLIGVAKAKDSPTSDIKLESLVGNYTRGYTGNKMSLDIKTDGTFAFGWQGGCGASRASKGKAKMQDGYLILTELEQSESLIGEQERSSPAEPNTMPAVYVPIHWDKRTYLIQSNWMVDFCTSINIGEEPRSKVEGTYYLRDDDWQKPAHDLPTLPPPWNKLQFSKSVQPTAPVHERK